MNDYVASQQTDPPPDPVQPEALAPSVPRVDSDSPILDLNAEAVLVSTQADQDSRAFAMTACVGNTFPHNMKHGYFQVRGQGIGMAVLEVVTEFDFGAAACLEICDQSRNGGRQIISVKMCPPRVHLSHSAQISFRHG